MSRSLALYSFGSMVARRVPRRLLMALARAAGRIVGLARPSLAAGLADNLSVAAGHPADRRIVADALASYGRYWAEMFVVPGLAPSAIDRGMSFTGVERLWEPMARGLGPIVVLPHLGGWEWAAAWLARVEMAPVTAAVERVEPEDLFDWFVELRASYGVNVVPVGPGSFGQLVAAVRDRHIVCLVGDRDISGNGVTVDFLGRTARFPLGPALLSIRTGAPLVPTSVAFRGDGRMCRLGEPLVDDGDGKLADRARRLTQAYADQLSELISSTPAQWHVMEPVFSGDNGPGQESAPGGDSR